MRFRRRNIQRKHCKAAAAEPYRKKILEDESGFLETTSTFTI